MAKNAVKSPLTESHYSQLKQLEKSVVQTREYLVKCDRCGLDIADELKTTDDQLKTIRGLIAEFFPTKPE